MTIAKSLVNIRKQIQANEQIALNKIESPLLKQVFAEVRKWVAVTLEWNSDLDESIIRDFWIGLQSFFRRARYAENKNGQVRRDMVVQSLDANAIV